MLRDPLTFAHSGSQLEPSLPGADKDSPRAALSASPIPAASPHSPAYRRETHKGFNQSDLAYTAVYMLIKAVTCYTVMNKELFLEVPKSYIHFLTSTNEF